MVAVDLGGDKVEIVVEFKVIGLMFIGGDSVEFEVELAMIKLMLG